MSHEVGFTARRRVVDIAAGFRPNQEDAHAHAVLGREQRREVGGREPRARDLGQAAVREAVDDHLVVAEIGVLVRHLRG